MRVVTLQRSPLVAARHTRTAPAADLCCEAVKDDHVRPQLVQEGISRWVIGVHGVRVDAHGLQLLGVDV
jgi:hypothetical protein